MKFLAPCKDFALDGDLYASRSPRCEKRFTICAGLAD
jgi:hypothetical protein